MTTTQRPVRLGGHLRRFFCIYIYIHVSTSADKNCNLSFDIQSHSPAPNQRGSFYYLTLEGRLAINRLPCVSAQGQMEQGRPCSNLYDNQPGILGRRQLPILVAHESFCHLLWRRYLGMTKGQMGMTMGWVICLFRWPIDCLASASHRLHDGLAVWFVLSGESFWESLSAP